MYSSWSKLPLYCHVIAAASSHPLKPYRIRAEIVNHERALGVVLGGRTCRGSPPSRAVTSLHRSGDTGGRSIRMPSQLYSPSHVSTTPAR